jgi:hypothetical protein
MLPNTIIPSFENKCNTFVTYSFFVHLLKVIRFQKTQIKPCKKLQGFMFVRVCQCSETPDNSGVYVFGI